MWQVADRDGVEQAEAASCIGELTLSTLNGPWARCDQIGSFEGRVCRSFERASAPMRQRKPRDARPARTKAASVDVPMSLPLFP
ncbi:hypothetical protein [Burkholderia sp. WP9]|uniref:hypothetical protein n=1 Tax=Burkholderia sp. WP9 TaxID=1500263 RepID=UPI000B85631C|nr:hypothetical protein [Burkholderia sp. WP9]